jgi:hypothetical protein
MTCAHRSDAITGTEFVYIDTPLLRIIGSVLFRQVADLFCTSRAHGQSDCFLLKETLAQPAVHPYIARS